MARIPDGRTPQNTVVYVSGRGQRGQMFLPPGADNPSYTTALARQCKCSCFSLPLWETRKTTERSANRPAASTARLCSPVGPTRRPISDRVPSPPIGDRRFPGPSSGGRSAIVLPLSRSPIPSPRRITAGYVHCLQMAWDPGNSIGDRPAIVPLFAPLPAIQRRSRWAKSRVSIETWELRLSTRECDFLGINIPSQRLII